MFEHKTFMRFVDESFEQGLDIVCLSIVKTEGSTYQKAGTTMLVNSAHEMVGVLSGGCIEEALLHCCDEVLKAGHGKRVSHDLRLPDDSLQSWEEGVGCNGVIDVWLEPFYAHENYGILGEALSYAKEGIPMTWTRCVSAGAKTASVLEQSTLHVKTQYDEATQSLSQPMNPVFKVLILGVGSGVQALVDIANVLGWETWVGDTRCENLSTIAHADRTIVFDDAYTIEALMQEERFDAGVIMSHLFKDDVSYLHTLLHSRCRYIGLLGSKERSQKLIECLGDRAALDERFHAPMGLAIGAKTPQAIALSICAQIESVKNKRG